VQSDERLRIDTPEQIALEVSVAGIGSRFLAVAVDTVLQVTLAVAGLTALSVSGMTVGRVLPWLSLVGPPLMILLVFCIYWGYFALFEMVWSGRTPGKRLAGIRVIKDSGRPMNAYEAIARNVLRAIDFLPALYGVGVIVMMLNRNSRRIGDFVAGTVVVHDRHDRHDRPPSDGRLAGGIQPNGNRTARTSVTGHNVTLVTADELVLIESYLRRRFELDPIVRDQMAAQIAARITKVTGAHPETGQPVDEFLEGVARRVRDTARFR
jgi:uncharacterized RDD family membrane protein YckC